MDSSFITSIKYFPDYFELFYSLIDSDFHFALELMNFFSRKVRSKMSNNFDSYLWDVCQLFFPWNWILFLLTKLLHPI